MILEFAQVGEINFRQDGNYSKSREGNIDVWFHFIRKHVKEGNRTAICDQVNGHSFETVAK